MRFLAPPQVPLYKQILLGDLPWPGTPVEAATASVIKGFLTREPTKRLGCTALGVDEVKSHQFFCLAGLRSRLDWRQLERKQIVPPSKPPLKDECDISLIGADIDQADVVELAKSVLKHKDANNASTFHVFEGF